MIQQELPGKTTQNLGCDSNSTNLRRLNLMSDKKEFGQVRAILATACKQTVLVHEKTAAK